MTAAWGWGDVMGWKVEQKGKRTHEHEKLCGDCGGEEGIRRVNNNEKKCNENLLKNLFHYRKS